MNQISVWLVQKQSKSEKVLETRMFRLSDGEEIMTLAFVRFDTIPECDRRTDRQKDIPPLAIPAVCIARYANALVKMNTGDSNCRYRRYFKLKMSISFRF